MYCKRGFTLVEMLFVVIIAAGVMAFAFPSYRAARERARFQAATGLLVNLGNAVESITSDLSMQGLDIDIGASSPHFYAYSGLTEAVPSGQTLRETVEAAAAGATREQKVLKLLRSANYLKDFSVPEGYSFYVLQNNVSAGSAAGLCAASTTASPLTGTLVACMLKTGASDSDCFAGARYYQGGQFQTIRGANCTSSAN